MGGKLRILAIVAGAIVVVAAAAYAGAAVYNGAHDARTVTMVVEDPNLVTGTTGNADGSAATVPVGIDEDDRPLSDKEIRRASAAALAIVGTGSISEIDRSDDLGEAYEVEVRDGPTEYDIALDAEFRQVPNLRYDD